MIFRRWYHSSAVVLNWIIYWLLLMVCRCSCIFLDSELYVSYEFYHLNENKILIMHKLLKFHNYLSSSCLKSILLYYSDSENLTHQNEPHTVQSNDLLLNFHWSARYYSHFTFTILFSSYLSSVKKAIIICKLWFFMNGRLPICMYMIIML